MPKPNLQFGYNWAVPETAKAAWGARLIFPDDLVWDRQSLAGDEAECKQLSDWLNAGALPSALKEARRLANSYQIDQKTDAPYILYKDKKGMVVGNPLRSYGYLYIAAFFKEAA